MAAERVTSGTLPDPTGFLETGTKRAATISNAVVSDKVVTFGILLFVQATALGMFTTFYTEFMAAKQYAIMEV